MKKISALMVAVAAAVSLAALPAAAVASQTHGSSAQAIRCAVC